MAVSMAFPVLITRCVRIFWIFSLLQRDLMRWISLQSLSSSSMSCTSFINLYCVPLPEVFSYDHYEIFHRIVAIPLCIPSRREFAKRIFESENEKITSFQHESLIHSRHFRLKFDRAERSRRLHGNWLAIEIAPADRRVLSFRWSHKENKHELNMWFVDNRYQMWLSELKKIALWRLGIGNGNTFRKTATTFGIGKVTAAEIYYEFSDAINNHKDDFINAWRRRWYTPLPSGVGAIDETHVEIKAPQNNLADYFNGKQHYSVVTRAVAHALGPRAFTATGWNASVTPIGHVLERAGSHP